MAEEIETELRKIASELVQAGGVLAGLEVMVIMEDPNDDGRCVIQVPEGIDTARSIEILESWIDVIRQRQLNWSSRAGTG